MNKGHGTLRVAADLWPQIGSPGTCEAWAKAILLPDDYEIERVERDEKRPAELYKLSVVSEHIPVSDAEIMVEMYHRMDNGVAAFDHISLTRWTGEHWEEVACDR